MFTDQILQIQTTNQNMLVITLTWTTVDQCSLTLLSKSRIQLILLLVLEDLVEKVSVDRAQWVLMVVTILLVFVLFLEKESLLFPL